MWSVIADTFWILKDWSHPSQRKEWHPPRLGWALNKTQHRSQTAQLYQSEQWERGPQANLDMAEAAAAPKPSAEQIHACLKDLETLPSVSTDWFYLISSKWVKNLREEAANNSFSYEPLDNTVLLDEVAPEEKYFLLEPQDRFAPRLKRNLSRATDFLLVTQDAWSRVVALYDLWLSIFLSYLDKT